MTATGDVLRTWDGTRHLPRQARWAYLHTDRVPSIQTVATCIRQGAPTALVDAWLTDCGWSHTTLWRHAVLAGQSPTAIAAAVGLDQRTVTAILEDQPVRAALVTRVRTHLNVPGENRQTGWELSGRRLNVELGSVLLRVLDDAGMTQADLGRAVGVSRAMVNQWTNGTAVPTRERVERIVTVTGESRFVVLHQMVTSHRLDQLITVILTERGQDERWLQAQLGTGACDVGAWVGGRCDRHRTLAQVLGVHPDDIHVRDPGVRQL